VKFTMTRYVVGLALVVLGWSMWVSSDAPQPIPFREHGYSASYDGTTTQRLDASDVCKVLALSDGAVLLSGRVVVADPERDQGLLQTDEDEEGIFFEYQRSEGYLVRFGLPLMDNSVARVKIKTHTQDSEFNFAVLIQSSGAIRVVTDTHESTTQLGAAPVPRCDDGKLGEAAGLLPFSGTLRVFVSTATTATEFQDWLDEYREVTQTNQRSRWYQLPLYVGLVSTLFGGAVSDLLRRCRRRFR
jgi:hypothetical protein